MQRNSANTPSLFDSSPYLGRDDGWSILAALVDGGWLQHLRKTELAVLLIYAAQAGPPGVADLTGVELQRLLGHASAKEVRKARTSLERLGLLDRAEPGSGECRVCIEHHAPAVRRPADRRRAAKLGAAPALSFLRTFETRHAADRRRRDH